MTFADWQKKWADEHRDEIPYPPLYEAQLDAYIAGSQATLESMENQPERVHVARPGSWVKAGWDIYWVCMCKDGALRRHDVIECYDCKMTRPALYYSTRPVDPSCRS